MKWRKNLFLWLIVVIGFSVVLSKTNVYAKKAVFTIEDVKITATVLDNGDVQVKEQFVYDVDSMNGMMRTISYNGGDGIEEFTAKEISPDTKKLEVTVAEDDETNEYKIHRPATDETVTFELEYILKNVTIKHQDTASFYWQFFDEINESEFGNLQIHIQLPEKANKENAEIFAHDKLGGAIQFERDGSILYNVGKLPENEITEVRILFPKEWIENAQKESDDVTKQDVIDEELKWAKKTKFINFLAFVGFAIVVSSTVLLVVIAIYAYFKYDKERKGAKYPYFKDLPNTYSPVILSYLMSNKGISTKGMAAVLLDLVRKGVLTMEQTKTKGFKTLFNSEDYRFTKTNKEVALTEQETFLFNWLIKDIGKNGSVTISQIRDYAKKNTVKYSKNLDKWKASVRKEANAYGFFEENATAIWTFMMVGFVTLVVSIVFMWLFGMAIAAVPAVLSFVYLFYIRTIERKTTYGLEEFAKWKGFKEFLTDFSKMKDELPQSIVIWEQFLVYAVSLGIAKKVMEEIMVYLPNMHKTEEESFLYDYEVEGGHYLFNPDSFSALETALSSSLTPPSKGSGGGSSFGGGLGGGGGGVGGF